VQVQLRRLSKGLIVSVLAVVTGLTISTELAKQGVPLDIGSMDNSVIKQQYLDRHGKILNITYENRWNVHDVIPLYEIPPFLQKAFVYAEDQRFYEHEGVDWLARLSALRDNLEFHQTTRGASTLSEQVIKMLHNRPRNVWSRWLEGVEAQELERNHSKENILEFYLNQVPYQAQRRGVKQAASYYFDRDLETLHKKEILALAVIVRAPKWYDPRRFPKRLERGIATLADRLYTSGEIDSKQRDEIREFKLNTKRPGFHANASHFIDYARSKQADPHLSERSLVHTTLDSDLQAEIQLLLDSKLSALKTKQVNNGAVLVVDHEKNEIQAWVVGYAGDDNKSFTKIDPILVKRQPGSTLKPFLYTKAMEKGWTAATKIEDSPLENSVGTGLHSFQNYSRIHYGNVSVRQALGNSLNIPAVRAIQYVGVSDFLDFLNELGFESLSEHPDIYGDGLALGNGEVTLFELTQAYTTLARMGKTASLVALDEEVLNHPQRQIISSDLASLTANILSDPNARELEFGTNSILNFPLQTAVKTGTSSDYRDAWAVGYNDKFTVGVWFGNLDYTPMNEVTGSVGPAVVLRSVFNRLNYHRTPEGLYLSENLEVRNICSNENENDSCQNQQEYFLPGTRIETTAKPEGLKIARPTEGLQIAMDPRIPDQYEKFDFSLNQTQDVKHVDWFVNDVLVGSSTDNVYNWPLEKGKHTTYASVFLKDQVKPIKTQPIHYVVK